jgi:hypothetical protein
VEQVCPIDAVAVAAGAEQVPYFNVTNASRYSVSLHKPACLVPKDKY